MWVTSIQLKNEKGFVNYLAKKYDLLFYGYPLNTQFEDGELYVTFYGWTNASTQKTAQLCAEMEKHEMVKHFEPHDNSFLVCIRQPKEISLLYSNKIIYLRPIKVSSDNVQTYVIASWNREDLNEILQLKIPNVTQKLLYIKEQPIQNIGLFTPTKLTEKQQKAFLLAQERGYYSFPKRQAHLKDLARESDVSLATYQAHLRKAEQKVLSSYCELQ